jgi:hypothetical protein
MLCSSVAGNLRGNMRIDESRTDWEDAGERLDTDLALWNPLDLYDETPFRLVIVDMCFKQTCVIKQCF